MNIEGYFGPDMVKECIVQDAKRKVILKFRDGDVQVAVAEEEDNFNPEVGILWATMKHLMKKYGVCSAYKYVESCLQKDEYRKTHKQDKHEKHNKNMKQNGKKGTTKVCYENCEDGDYEEDDDDFVITIRTMTSIPEDIVYCHPEMALQLISIFDSIT